MNHLLLRTIPALAGMLILCACGSTAAAPADSVTATVATPSEPSAVPTATVITPSEPPAVATATVAAPSEPPAEATATVTAPVAATATPSPELPAGGNGNADVLFVRAVQAGEGSWTFHVTLEHPDTGWEDYADGWDVVTPDGTVIKPDPDSPFTRLLLHPHVGEQPFTRSQGGIVIPPGVVEVHVRGHDLVDGYGGREVIMDLTVASGPDFEVER